MKSSLEVTDDAAAAVAVAERVSLGIIEGKIGAVFHMTGSSVIGDAPKIDGLDRLTICLIVMRNGFVVIGKSAPASPENFDADLGRRFAYEDAIRQLWPLEGYALRERLAHR